MIIKLIIIIIIIAIFMLFVIKQIEGFSNKNYDNTEIISPEYSNIYSYLPYDIKSKNKEGMIYDFGNDELNELLKKAFNIDYKKIISLSEGFTWSKSIDNTSNSSNKRLNNYYTNIINDFNDKIKSPIFIIENTEYSIIKHFLHRYKIANENKNTYLLDLSIVIYRNKRPLAKHIKILCLCNEIFTNFLMVKVVGVIPECQLKKTTYDSFEPEYTPCIPSEFINYDMNSFIYDTNDKLANTQVELNLYYKLLKDLI